MDKKFIFAHEANMSDFLSLAKLDYLLKFVSSDKKEISFYGKDKVQIQPGNAQLREG